LTGFFSITGKDARSSLAAAAGGGVTAGTRAQKFVDSGDGAKKRQSRGCDKAGKQEADMRK
jgi:hypothetical protein